LSRRDPYMIVLTVRLNWHPCSILPTVACIVSRATCMPHQTDKPGIGRTTTVNFKTLMSWPFLTPPAWTHPANMPDKPPMAVAGHPRRMKMGWSSGRRRRFLGAESPLIPLTWEPRAPRTVATSTRLRFLW
jgi:hypothetical protein